MSGFREELGISGEAVVALYSGNMGCKQGLEILAEVAGICKLRQASRDESRPTSTTVRMIVSGIVFRQICFSHNCDRLKGTL